MINMETLTAETLLVATSWDRHLTHLVTVTLMDSTQESSSGALVGKNIAGITHSNNLGKSSSNILNEDKLNLNKINMINNDKQKFVTHENTKQVPRNNLGIHRITS
jgi:hypothetical protein